MKFILFKAAFMVAFVSAKDNFLDGAKRAMYFEKTDFSVPTWDFTLPPNEYTQLKSLIDGGNNIFGGNSDFKTKEAQLVFTLNGESKTFPEVTFSIGGVSSRYYPKQGFNVKIRNDELFGRKQFRIRSEAREATFLRSKLFCDINNRIGLPDSISANYMKMSINGEDLGFYVVMDSLKMTTVKIEYDDQDTTNLIQCSELNSDLTSNSMRTCESENEDNPDMSNFNDLLNRLDRARKVSEMEKILDVDTLMKSVLMDYLTGSWDQFCLYGHNFSMYKPPNGKWEMVLYDFDATFGQDLSMGLLFRTPKGIIGNDIDTWTKAKFEDWHGNKHVISVILQDKPEIFRRCLQEIITNAFNPKLLFPYIDALKDFIRPYVTEDKTPINGKLPGRLNTHSTSFDYTLSQWEANSEFTHINTQFNSMTSQGYALKRWILDKFNFVCTTYDWLDCSVASEYLNNSFTYTTTTFSTPTNAAPQNGDGWGGLPGGGFPGGDFPGGNWGIPATTSKKPQPTNGNCWSEALGYSCCVNANVKVDFIDDDGEWGIENGEWCGIPKSTCWSEPLGFSCCSVCGAVIYTDQDGNWGVENDNWCGLPKNC